MTVSYDKEVSFTIKYLLVLTKLKRKCFVKWL